MEGVSNIRALCIYTKQTQKKKDGKFFSSHKMSAMATNKEMLSFDESIRAIFDRVDTGREKKEKENSRMTMDGLKDTSDKFWFLTKLLKHGIVHLFSRGENGLDLDSLTTEDFYFLNTCMNKVGVNVDVQVSPLSSDFNHLGFEKYFDDTKKGVFNVAMSYAVANNAPDRLENHILFLFTRTRRYAMRYLEVEESL